MPSTPWDTQQIDAAPLVAAPDGSAVRILCATERGGMISFIPVGAQFQFRNGADQPLRIVAVTMPRWPGEGEAVVAIGAWVATI
jgi:hypothetical protein